VPARAGRSSGSGSAGSADQRAGGSIHARPFLAAEHPLGPEAEVVEAPPGDIVPGARIGRHGLAADQVALASVTGLLQRADSLEDGTVELWQLMGRGDAFHGVRITPQSRQGNSPLVPSRTGIRPAGCTLRARAS